MLEKVELYKLLVAKHQLWNHIVDFQGFSEGLALIKTLEKGYYYINHEGIPVIKGGKWHYAENFYEGYAVVATEHDGYQFIDNKGNVAIAKVAGKELNFASHFSNGLALIQNEDEVYQYINHNGEVVIDGKNWKDACDFYHGEAMIVNRYGECQFIDYTGKVIRNVIDIQQEPLVPDYFSTDILAAKEYHEGLRLECDATGTLAIINENNQITNYDEIRLSPEEFRALRLQFDCPENDYHEYLYNNRVKLQICYGIQYQNNNEEPIVTYFRNQKTRDAEYEKQQLERKVCRKR